MKKKLIGRGVIGFPVGIAIGVGQRIPEKEIANFQFVELNIRMIRLRYGSIPIPQILISRPCRPV